MILPGLPFPSADTQYWMALAAVGGMGLMGLGSALAALRRAEPGRAPIEPIAPGDEEKPLLRWLVGPAYFALGVYLWRDVDQGLAELLTTGGVVLLAALGWLRRSGGGQELGRPEAPPSPEDTVMTDDQMMRIANAFGLGVAILALGFAALSFFGR